LFEIVSNLKIVAFTNAPDFKVLIDRVSIPVVLGFLIQYVDGVFSNDVGLSLAGVFIVLIFLNSFIQQRAWFALDYMGMKARVAVTGLIFQKVVQLFI